MFTKPSQHDPRHNTQRPYQQTPNALNPPVFEFKRRFVSIKTVRPTKPSCHQFRAEKHCFLLVTPRGRSSVEDNKLLIATSASQQVSHRNNLPRNKLPRNKLLIAQKLNAKKLESQPTTQPMQFESNNLETIRYGPDSYYIRNFLSTVLGLDHQYVFNQFLAQIDWVERDNTAILYRGNQINRTKGFFTANTELDPVTRVPLQIYKYVYPGFTYRILLQHRCFNDLPILDGIVERITSGLTFHGDAITINHGIATQYIHPTDGIGAHQDKLKSIVRATPILSLSLGGRREMQLTDFDGKLIHALEMEPGSLFVLGPETNLTMKHAIVPTEQETIQIERPGGVTTPRISIVLRNIADALTERRIVRTVMNSIKMSLKKSPFPSVQAELNKLKQQTTVSLNDVCVLDSLFEEKRQQRKQQEQLTTYVRTGDQSEEDELVQSEDSSENDLVQNKVPQKKLKLF